jgi:hypothetical protein
MMELIAQSMVIAKLNPSTEPSSKEQNVTSFSRPMKDKAENSETKVELNDASSCTMNISLPKQRKCDESDPSFPSPKRQKGILTTSKNFLGMWAQRAKQARSARNAARVGVLRQTNKVSHNDANL